MENIDFKRRVKFVLKFGRALHAVGSPAHTLEGTLQEMCEIMKIKHPPAHITVAEIGLEISPIFSISTSNFVVFVILSTKCVLNLATSDASGWFMVFRQFFAQFRLQRFYTWKFAT